MPGRGSYSEGYRFGWQSQERTDEISGTGNHYTAKFWEYDPRVVTRWNNDPVVKPWQSPYVILSNNPIWRIDPNGDDDYKVDKKGNISLVKETDAKQDVLFATDKKGNILEDKSFTADKGIFNNSRTNTVEGSNGKSYTLDQYDVQDDDKSKGLFEFVSNNTEVEWSLTGIGNKEGEKGKSILTTSHKKSSEIGGGYLLAYGYTIRSHKHSHPFHKTPSTADKGFAKSVNKKFPKAKLEIFHIGKYFEYDQSGSIMKIPTITLPEIEISVPKKE
jgi:hypothetical protein